MDTYSFAVKYLQPFKIKDTLIVADCPFCHGGDHHDRETFAMNRHTGTYMCQRGTCNAKGDFAQLLDALGEEEMPTLPNSNIFVKTKKNYVLPTLTTYPITETILDYFDKRRISKSTLDAYGICAAENGDILFPLYRDTVLIGAKFRKPRKPEKKEPKEIGVKGMEPILFGMDTVSADLDYLVITEGEIDTLSLYEAGVRNVVSVPCGCSNMEWIELCFDWLERFSKIVIFGDNDPPGKKMRDQVTTRLDASRCWIIDDDRYPARPDGFPCKDANEILYFHGADILREVFESASPVPVKGLLDLGDIEPVDPTTIPRIQTRIPDVDAFLGGLQEGGLTVFTALPGHGKSTLAGQICLSAIDQGWDVCAYSGELPKEKFQQWVFLQAAGSDYITLKYDPIRQINVPIVPYDVHKSIANWVRGHFYLFDNNEIFESNQSTSILEVFAMAARRYGVKLFLVDNLMTALSDCDEETKAQTKFVNALKKFAIQFSCHVIVVDKAATLHSDVLE